MSDITLNTYSKIVIVSVGNCASRASQPQFPTTLLMWLVGEIAVINSTQQLLSRVSKLRTQIEIQLRGVIGKSALIELSP